MDRQRVALYARVSTINGQQDPEMQLREQREYAKRRGWEVEAEYVDRGVSGSKDRRPALDRLMVAAQGRKFDVFLIWKLDRYARSLKHLVNALAQFEALGIAFVSLRDNLDLTTPAGRLMFQIIGAMAEFERALIQERVRAGLRNARAKGKRLGRPRHVYPQPKVERLRALGLQSSFSVSLTARQSPSVPLELPHTPLTFTDCSQRSRPHEASIKMLRLSTPRG
jgi:DNA invertase Pin-like site-specific DNA recombinase